METGAWDICEGRTNSGLGDTMNHEPFIVHNVSKNTDCTKENLFRLICPRRGLELGSMGPRAGVLPIEPPLLFTNFIYNDTLFGKILYNLI